MRALCADDVEEAVDEEEGVARCMTSGAEMVVV